MNIIYNNPITVAIIVIIVIALIFFVYNRRKDILRKAALYFVTIAEETWGSQTGQIKFNEVYMRLKDTYPILTFFLSEKQLSTIIENALVELKVILMNKEPEQDELEFTDKQ